MLTDNEQEALQSLVNHLNAIDKVNTTMNNITETCFHKCVDSKASRSNLTSDEGQCVINCVNGILDINGTLISTTFKSVGLFRF
jgi:hypothetical protein